MARHSDFSIGAFFRCAEEVWRCTDVGTRTVVAVQWTNAYIRMTSRDWTGGPPYALSEEVFDENDFCAMELVADPDFCPTGS